MRLLTDSLAKHVYPRLLTRGSGACRVKQVSISVRGKASKQRCTEQKQFWFRRLQRFQAGSVGRISLLKRAFSLDKSLMWGNKGTQIWVGQGIFAHNLWQAARLIRRRGKEGDRKNTRGKFKTLPCQLLSTKKENDDFSSVELPSEFR